MPFTDRFQLLGLKRDEGACSFEAREIATGRPVLVHLFADRTSPLNRALLAKFDVLPASERSRIIDRGEHEGGVYIVTDRLAEYPGLHEWLRAKHADRAKPLDHGGAWQIKPPEPKLSVDDQWASLFPTAPRPVLEPSPMEEPKAPVLTDTGEHTLQMPAPPTPAPRMAAELGEFAPPAAPPVLRPVVPPVPKVEPPPVAPTPPPAEPGEFTRQFAPPVLRPVPPKAVPPPVAPTPPPAEPGEFTREFAPSVLRPALPKVEPVPAAPTPPPNEPGEFTRQFAPPVLRPAAPPAPAPQEPGEFTRQFAATPPKPQAPPKPTPGEFTKQFQSPQRSVPAPTPRPMATSPSQSGEHQPGEFTQMLQAQRPAAPAPPGSVSSGEFTRFFESPMTPPAPGAAQHIAPLTPTPSAPKGAGEFTQIFGRDSMPSAPPAPAPAAPPPDSSGNATQVFNTQRPAPPQFPTPAPNIAPQGPGEYTRMFARPAPLTFGQAPAGPQTPRVPESAPVARNNSRLPLLLVIGAAVLLIIAAVVYYLMRPHTT